jgi:hypothetical protein
MRTTLGFLVAGVALAQTTPTGIQKTGAVTLVRTEGKFSAGPLGSVESTTDNFAAIFQMTDYTNYTPGQIPPITMIGPCTVVVVTGPSPTTGTQPVVTPLDAGSALNVNGPNGSKQFTAIKPGLYGGTLGGGIALPIPGAPPVAPLYLDPGTYTVDNGGGGADIGPFMASLTLPSPTFTWTNADANLTIDRTVGVDIQWTGGDPNGKVAIQGLSSAPDPTSGQNTAALFICSVDNTGDFFVTPDVLSLLPATPTGGSTPAASALTVSTSVQASFNAPGSDLSSFTFQSSSSRGVVYQ